MRILEEWRLRVSTITTDRSSSIKHMVIGIYRIHNKVDKAMAEAKCASSIARMEFLSSTLPHAISTAKEEILSGVLRNSRGTKVYVSLMDTVLVVY
jgi:hypothetical protein